MKLKQKVLVIYEHDTDSAMNYNRAIPYIVNTLKYINLNSDLSDELYTKMYSKRSAIFGYIFRIFIKPSIDKIYQLELIE